MKHLRNITMAALAVTLAACSGSDAAAVAALEVEVRDARTGAPAAYGATIIARDGDYADTVRVAELYPDTEAGNRAGLLLGVNRPGTYDVTVTRPGYRTWTREDVRVRTSGGSSVFDGSPIPETVKLQADLEPAGS